MITIGVGSLSMMYRMARMGGIKSEMMPRDYNMFGNIMQDGAWAFIGFVMSQWYTSTYVYKQRQYVLERIRLEQETNYHGRNDFSGELLEEYPLAKKCVIFGSDATIHQERYQPADTAVQAQAIGEKLQAIENEYIDERKKQEDSLRNWQKDK